MRLLSTETITFLAGLRANNDRQWFEANRDAYHTHFKEAGEGFAQALAKELETAMGEPHEYRLFRIHRDVRFSKDKTPYNAHLHISFAPVGGCKGGGPTWMFGLDPDGVTLGSGIFSFSHSQLDPWRVLVAGPDGSSVAALVDRLRADQVRIGDPESKRAPAAYPSDHPRVELLRRKGLTAWIDGSGSETAISAQGPVNCALTLLKLRELYQVLRYL
jgi:uncharacterized protein (TIGR02453 family)